MSVRHALTRVCAEIISVRAAGRPLRDPCHNLQYPDLADRAARAGRKIEHARGFLRIELDVYADNAAALALYARFGFEREGVRRAAALLAGRYRDICVMGLLSPRISGAGG